MIALLSLRALGWTKAPVVAAVIPRRLSDPLGDAVTRALVIAKLWRHDATLGLERDHRRVSARLFLPEHAQSDRECGRQEAQKARHVMADALREEGFVAIFTDALWCERGTKGWAVIGRGAMTSNFTED